MDSRYLVGAISILVTVILVGSVMVPIMDYSTSGVEYEDNPDWDGWIRFELNRSAASYEISITQDENGIYVGAGTDVQAYDDSSTGEYATIFYADSNTVVWADDGDAYKIMGTSNGSPVYFTTASDLTVSRDSNGVTVTDGVDSFTFDTPSWAYVPKSTGTYGFYPYAEDRGVPASDAPTAVVGGGFAGVYAYNDIYRYAGLGLSMVPIVEGGTYYGATWEKQTADAGEFDPDDITIVPLDPSVIGCGDYTTISPIDNPIVIDDPFDPGAVIMSVPTPTYTEGDWGYDVIQVDGVDKAVIVSYSGAGGDIVVPSTIGGYDVYRLGQNPPTGNLTTNNVFNNSTLSANSTLTISEGIVQIGNYACATINKFVSVSLPSTLKEIGVRGFESVTASVDTLIIPDGVIFIGAYATNKFNATKYIIPASVNEIQWSIIPIATKTAIIASDAQSTGSLFVTNSTVEYVLDLSAVEYTAGIGNIPSTATVSDSIGDCFGFIADTQIAKEGGGLSNFKTILYTIPIVVLAGLLVATAAFMIRRDY